MGGECEKKLNLGGFVFDEENHERKSRKFFGRTCNRSLLVFMCQLFVIVLILAYAIVRIMLSTTCEETTVWVAILLSTVGHILPSPSYELKKCLTKNDFTSLFGPLECQKSHFFD